MYLEMLILEKNSDFRSPTNKPTKETEFGREFDGVHACMRIPKPN